MAFYFESGLPPMISIPSSLAEGYLSVASGAQIKVMLCLIRFEGMPMREEDIAKQCRLDTTEVHSAIDFWVKEKLLSRRGSTLCLQAPETVQEIKLPTYTSDEILSLKEEDADFAQILEAAQGVLGKIFNHNDASILYGIYDNLGFGGDLVLQLLGFCAGMGKKNFRYIERVALDWHDRGIDSFEKADSYIRHMEQLAKDEHKVAEAFGIAGRALSKKEKEFIATWREQWGMPFEMIEAAYEVCVDAKGKLSFPYINGILSDWHTKGWKTPEQIEKKQTATKSSTDFSEFELAAVAELHED
ncbi:MAG: DnaD domain protein [Clostridia bacterium]|nr:DnaD domain protein [Clostridia bacterium]